MLTRSRLAVLAAFIALIALVPARLAAAHDSAAVPTGFTDTTFAQGFAGRLTSMTFGPDGRLYVSEKEGNIRIVDSNGIVADPFLTIPTATTTEKGLKAIAFDPNYATNGYIYVYYTDAVTLKNKVSRFIRVDANHADPASEKVLVDGINSGTFHDGGSLHFGPDGKLYVSTGDASYAPFSQQLGNLNGKILRINTDGSTPADNPFVGQAGAKPQIWALGLRNPFTFAFNRAGTLYINDVGEATWEEINLGARGANYGWPTCEGVCGVAGMTNPIYAYRHDAGPGKSITGGTFYEATQFPAAYQGKYFFGDYVGNYIKLFDPQTRQATDFATNAANPVDLDVGPDGALYYLSVEAKEVHRISYGETGPTPPPTPPPGDNLLRNGDFETTGTGWLAPWRTVVRSPQTMTVTKATTNSFSGAQSFRADMSTASQDWYAQLLQPGVALSSGVPTTLTFAAKSLAPRSLRVAFQKNSGTYPVYFQQTFALDVDWQTYSITFTPPASDPQALFAFNFGNAAGRLWIDDVALTAATIVGHAPAPTISTPALGTTYRAGQVISFSGSATDPEDGPLPASALTWEIVFHHDTHTHPFIDPFSGVTSGRFTIPDTGETSSNTWYRIHLRATDSDGNTSEVTRDIFPLKSNVTLATSPSGLGLTINGIPVTAPYTFTGVVGFKRELAAPLTQTLNGTSYRFVAWSDGGAATHTIATPGVARTYTAYYEPDSANVLRNGSFDLAPEAWLSAWRTVIRAPASATFVRDTAAAHSAPAALRVDLANNSSAANDWYVQLMQPNVPLTSGAQYRLTFSARSNAPRSIRVAFQQNGGKYPVYFQASVPITAGWQTYSLIFTPATTDPATLFSFNVAGPAGSVWLDDVSLTGGNAVRR